MTRRVRIAVVPRAPIDFDRLAVALLGIVADLDEATIERLAVEGQQFLDGLEDPRGDGSEAQS